MHITALGAVHLTKCFSDCRCRGVDKCYMRRYAVCAEQSPMIFCNDKYQFRPSFSQGSCMKSSCGLLNRFSCALNSDTHRLPAAFFGENCVYTFVSLNKMIIKALQASELVKIGSNVTFAPALKQTRRCNNRICQPLLGQFDRLR